MTTQIKKALFCMCVYVFEESSAKWGVRMMMVDISECEPRTEALASFLFVESSLYRFDVIASECMS